MDIQKITDFFMWCTIINGGLLLLWTTISLLAPDLVYRKQNKWFPMPRETFTVVFRCVVLHRGFNFTVTNHVAPELCVIKFKMPCALGS